MKKYFSFLIVICGICIYSCTQRLGDFTILSTKNIDFTKVSTFEKTKTRTTGEDLTKMICIIPTGSIPPNMKEAIDEAIEKVPGGVALYDAVIYYKNITAIVYAKLSFVVEGTVIIDPAYASNPLNSTGYIISYYDPKVKKQITLAVAENDYNEMKLSLKNKDDDRFYNVLIRLASL